MTAPLPVSQDRKLAAGVFALLLASYAYFYQGGGWNENSRMDLVRALVEHQTFAIDAFHLNTGDKAIFQGHYYSDKAPGVSLLGVPAYALMQVVRPLFASDHDFLVLSTYVVTVVTVGICSALLGALVFAAARRLGATRGASILTAVGYGLGTMAFPLSTMLFSHQVAGLLLFSAFYLSMRHKEAPSSRLVAGVALCLAGAVVVEFPTAIAAPILALYHFGPSFRGKRAAIFAAGLAVPALVLGVYLWSSFGSPFRVGYGFLSDPGSRAEMNVHRLFGLTYPKPSVVFELLVGRLRGLLPYSPVLALATVGLFSRKHKAERFTIVALIVAYLLFVSSYEWWQGGSSFGSRHLAPVLPFWMLPLSWLAARSIPKITAVAVAASVATMLVVTSVQPKPSERLTNPFWGTLLPAFERGMIPANNLCPVTGRPDGQEHVPLFRAAAHDAFNLGVALGGRGHKSLVPLLTLWGLSAWSFSRALRRKAEQGRADEDDPQEHG